MRSLCRTVTTLFHFYISFSITSFCPWPSYRGGSDHSQNSGRHSVFSWVKVVYRWASPVSCSLPPACHAFHYYIPRIPAYSCRRSPDNSFVSSLYHLQYVTLQCDASWKSKEQNKTKVNCWLKVLPRFVYRYSSNHERQGVRSFLGEKQGAFTAVGVLHTERNENTVKYKSRKNR